MPIVGLREATLSKTSPPCCDWWRWMSGHESICHSDCRESSWRPATVTSDVCLVFAFFRASLNIQVLEPLCTTTYSVTELLTQAIMLLTCPLKVLGQDTQLLWLRFCLPLPRSFQANSGILIYTTTPSLHIPSNSLAIVINHWTQNCLNLWECL
jgi:hypothetical protein